MPQESQADGFFCNKAAFSQRPHATRVLEVYQYYRDAAVALSSEWKDESWGTIPFRNAHLKLNKLRKHIKSCGSLTLWLILADMAESGLIRQPTPEDASPLIHEINAGGVDGMIFARYLPPRSGTGKKPRHHKSLVATAFKSFYDDISAALTTEEKSDMGWNVVMAEHTLCKIWRLKDHLSSLAR